MINAIIDHSKARAGECWLCTNLENGKEHVVLGQWGRLVQRMRRRMDDAVHIQVQVVEFDSVGIWERRVDRNAIAGYCGQPKPN